MKLSYLLALPLAWAAPILTPRAGEEVIPGKFIVVMKDSASNALLQTTITSVTGLLGARPRHVYNMGTFKGFSVSSTDALIQTVANLGAVSHGFSLSPSNANPRSRSNSLSQTLSSERTRS